MFPARMFAPRLFAPRYWATVGATVAEMLAEIFLADLSITRLVAADRSIMRVGGGTAPSYPAQTLLDLPTAFWQLDELAGPTAVDLSGGGYHGTYVGAPTLGASGLVPNSAASLQLAGDVADHVLLPTALRDALTGATGVTFAAWVKVGRTGAPAQVAIGISGAYHALYLSVSTRPACTFNVSGTQRVATASVALALGATRFVVGTWSSGDYVRLYVNGVQVATSPAAYSGAISTNLLASYLGRTVAGNPYTGNLDEAAIFLSALSPAQVAEQYAAALGLRAATLSITRLVSDDLER